jgi:arylsulfatase
LFNNTLVVYILGDNGASAEGFHGTIDELLTENSLPNTAQQQIEARHGGAPRDATGMGKCWENPWKTHGK